MSETAGRVADVIGALTNAADLAVGVPLETSIRTSVLATRLAEARGLSIEERSHTYWASLLRHLGCTAYAHEAAELGAGDDQHFLRVFEGIDKSRPLGAASRAVRELAKDSPLRTRVSAVARALVARDVARALPRAQCAQATALATDLGMSAGVVLALGQIYERYDGKGEPHGLAAETISTSARVVGIATLSDALYRQGGADLLRSELARRRGGELDPALVDTMLADLDAFVGVLRAPSIWDAFLDAEPSPRLFVGEGRLDDIAIAFGRYADFKAPMKLGHAERVARLSTDAGRAAGLDEGTLADLRRAALLHDVGTVSVPTGIWEKPAPLDASEWERVRLHAYYTQRILRRVPAFVRVAEIAAQHHERCDGSGYPHGNQTSPTDRAARILQAADAYDALVSARPHRPARAAAEAAKLLDVEVRASRLCPQAVDALLGSVGQRVEPLRRARSDLTARESEVLVELARGRSSKEIALALDISTRTVNHHIEHVYRKLGVSSRAAAALHAVRHGLVD